MAAGHAANSLSADTTLVAEASNPPARFRSLRTRLLVALLGIVVVTWAMAIGAWLLINIDEQSIWDRTLRSKAKIALASLPPNFDRVIADPASEKSVAQFARSAGSEAQSEVAMQVWVNGEDVLHTPGAPVVPLKPDFLHGFADQRIDGQVWRVYDVADASGKVHVQAGKSPRQRAYSVLRIAGAGGVALLLLLILPGIAIWWVTRWSFAPIDELRRTIATREALDLKPLPTGKLLVEVQPLVESFNALLLRLDSAIENERRFIADAAHELRTPLAVLLAQVQLVLNADDVVEKNAAAKQLAAGVERSARLSEQLLDMARLDSGNDTPERTDLDLSEIVVLVARDFENTARQRRQSIGIHVETVPLRANIDDIGILLRNLLDNALRYGNEGGRVDISCQLAQRGEARVARLSVSDDGPGVPINERARIFRRFHRVAGGGGSGSGIGLSLVQRIVVAHGGSIDVGPGSLERGLEIIVWLPSDRGRSDPY
jgi:signal transduction histidine kinase